MPDRRFPGYGGEIGFWQTWCRGHGVVSKGRRSMSSYVSRWADGLERRQDRPGRRRQPATKCGDCASPARGERSGTLVQLQHEAVRRHRSMTRRRTNGLCIMGPFLQQPHLSNNSRPFSGPPGGIRGRIASCREGLSVAWGDDEREPGPSRWPGGVRRVPRTRPGSSPVLADRWPLWGRSGGLSASAVAVHGGLCGSMTSAGRQHMR
jgi:hypothetical protein